MSETPAPLTAEERERALQIAATAPDTEVGRLIVRMVATLDRDRAARDALPSPCLECGGLGHWTAERTGETFDCAICGGSGEGDVPRALDMEALERILPAALAEADTEGSDADDWLGSEYVMRLAEAIVKRLPASPSRAGEGCDLKCGHSGEHWWADPEERAAASPSRAGEVRAMSERDRFIALIEALAYGEGDTDAAEQAVLDAYDHAVEAALGAARPSVDELVDAIRGTEPEELRLGRDLRPVAQRILERLNRRPGTGTAADPA